MTHPDSRYWDQPSRDAILIDNTHALMSQGTFDALKDYSLTRPTGTYPGKMWKRGEPYVGPQMWYLCWYTPSETLPDTCDINWRPILLA